MRRGYINRCPWQLNGCCRVSTLWSRWRFYRAESLVWRDNDKQNITECIKHQKLVFICINQLLIDLLPPFQIVRFHTKAVAMVPVSVLHTHSLCRSHELHRNLPCGVRTPRRKADTRQGCNIKVMEPLKSRASLNSSELPCKSSIPGISEETWL